MKLFGLTGGLGMGKSASAGLLAQLEMATVDTDQLAREVTAPGEPALEEIERAFEPEVFDNQGRLSRAALAEQVFADPEARRRLEAILHPRIRRRWQAEVERWRQSGVRAGVVVIPLLYETDAARHFDSVICVACSGETQRRRLRDRGWSDAEIDQRLQAQWPIEEKLSRAEYVVWTEPILEVHMEQLEWIFVASGLRPARRADDLQFIPANESRPRTN